MLNFIDICDFPKTFLDEREPAVANDASDENPDLDSTREAAIIFECGYCQVSLENKDEITGIATPEPATAYYQFLVNDSSSFSDMHLLCSSCKDAGIQLCWIENKFYRPETLLEIKGHLRSSLATETTSMTPTPTPIFFHQNYSEMVDTCYKLPIAQQRDYLENYMLVESLEVVLPSEN